MSQRNPMNERYQTDKRQGTTRKSAASAKPKAKAAASVTYGTPKKDPKAKKAEIKAQRKAESERQREIDRKYYKPDTERYRKLRGMWWATLIGAVVCTAASWFLRGVEPAWLAMGCLILAYVLIIFAFYLDFSKIRKERRAYQARMVALELAQQKEAEKAARASRAHGNKGKGKAAQLEEASRGEGDAGDEGAEGDAAAAQAEDSQKPAKKLTGLFSRKAAPETQE